VVVVVVVVVVVGERAAADVDVVVTRGGGIVVEGQTDVVSSVHQRSTHLQRAISGATVATAATSSSQCHFST